MLLSFLVFLLFHLDFFFFFVAPRGKIIVVKKKKKILHKVLFISWMLHEKGKNITTILLMTLHLIKFYQSCKENLMLWKGKKSKNWVRVYLFIWLSPNYFRLETIPMSDRRHAWDTFAPVLFFCWKFTGNVRDTYLVIFYLSKNLSHYLLFTLLDVILGCILIFKHYILVMNSLYCPLLLLNWYMFEHYMKKEMLNNIFF